MSGTDFLSTHLQEDEVFYFSICFILLYYGCSLVVFV